MLDKKQFTKDCKVMTIKQLMKHYKRSKWTINEYKRRLKVPKKLPGRPKMKI